jgi:hypothetical protein
MTDYTYSRVAALNFNTTPASVAKSATGSVYAAADTHIYQNPAEASAGLGRDWFLRALVPTLGPSNGVPELEEVATTQSRNPQQVH